MGGNAAAVIRTDGMEKEVEANVELVTLPLAEGIVTEAILAVT